MIKPPNLSKKMQIEINCFGRRDRKRKRAFQCHFFRAATVSLEAIVKCKSCYLTPLGQIIYIRPALILLIVSITKFSNVIGSPRPYLQRNRRVITWVSDLNFVSSSHTHVGTKTEKSLLTCRYTIANQQVIRDA